MFLPLDGPSLQITLSVGTGAIVQAKVGASPLTERKVITLQPTTGKMYLYFGNEATIPSAATVAADGLVIFKNRIITLEASESQFIYLLSLSGTINVKLVERA